MSDVITQAKAELQNTKERIVGMLATTPDDRINWSPSPTARTPLQLVGHSALAVNGIQGMLTGKPFPFDDITNADAAFRAMDREFTTREQALTQLEQACAEYTAWLDTLTPEQLGSTLQTLIGPIPMTVGITFAAEHMRGHTSQIDYIQTIYGDHDWHM